MQLTLVPTRCSMLRMEDYPQNQLEFSSRFDSEEACHEYLFAMRWSDGFKCPQCGNSTAWPTSRYEYRCSECDLQTSITSGTIFHRTRKPLQLWFQAMWSITSQKYGANALGLQRILGLGSYHTAWEWLHKLRRAMVRPGREKLSASLKLMRPMLVGRNQASEVEAPRGKLWS